MGETCAVSTNLSDPAGKAVFSGIIWMDHGAPTGPQPVLVVDGIAYGADDVLYGEDGSWGKAGEIVLSSSLLDGTHDTGSLADKFIALMTDRLPVVDHSRLDRIRRENSLRRVAFEKAALPPAAELTETDWLNSRTPRAMLKLLESRARTGEFDRRLRLFACACVRRIWPMLDDQRSRNAVEVAERYADGLVDREELDAAGAAAEAATTQICRTRNLEAAWDAWIAKPDSHRDEIAYDAKDEVRAWTAADAAHSLTVIRRIRSHLTNEVYEARAWPAALSSSRSAYEAAASADILTRRQASFEARIRDWHFYEDTWQSECLRCIFGNPSRLPTITPDWSTRDVAEFARAIYDERAFGRLPILGNALEDAGCTDPDMLSHCREPVEHVRGCWVVDALLGRR